MTCGLGLFNEDACASQHQYDTQAHDTLRELGTSHLQGAENQQVLNSFSRLQCAGCKGLASLSHVTLAMRGSGALQHASR